MIGLPANVSCRADRFAGSAAQALVNPNIKTKAKIQEPMKAAQMLEDVLFVK